MAAKSSLAVAPRAANGFRPDRHLSPSTPGSVRPVALTGPGARFSASVRVLTSAEFKRIFKYGRRTATPLMALHVLAEEEGSARLGIVVSRKVDKRAVGRNRIKRVVREYFRRIRAQLPPGAYVVLARMDAQKADNAQLRQTLERLMMRAGVLWPKRSLPHSTPRLKSA